MATPGQNQSPNRTVDDPIAHEVKMQNWRSDNRIKAAGLALFTVIFFTIWQKVAEAIEEPGPLDTIRETYASIVETIGSEK